MRAEQVGFLERQVLAEDLDRALPAAVANVGAVDPSLFDVQTDLGVGVDVGPPAQHVRRRRGRHAGVAPARQRHQFRQRQVFAPDVDVGDEPLVEEHFFVVPSSRRHR